MKKPLYKKWWFWVIVLFVIGIIANLGDDTEKQAEPAKEAAAAPESNAKEDKPQEEEKSNEPNEEEWQASYREILLSEGRSYIQLTVRGTISKDRFDSAVGVLKQQFDKLKGDDTAKYEELVKAVEKDDLAAAKEIYKSLGGKDFEELHQEPKPKEVEKPISLNGTGDSATDFVQLSAGFAVINATHTGGRNFVIQFLDESGTEELLVNTIGNYKGSTFVEIPADGKYMLNVTADGKWTAKITQSFPDDIPNAPTTLSGTGDSVVFVNLKSKLNKFSFKHSGERNFVVTVNGRNLLVNEIGNYSGSVAQKVEDNGTYIFVVNADGKWSIDIQ